MKLLTLLLASLVSGEAGEAPAVFRIGGTVVDSQTGKPLRKIRVVLSPSDRLNLEVSSWTTGDDGTFAFDVLKGKYSLLAHRQGTGQQHYGSVSLESGFGVAVITGPGQATDQLTFPIDRPSAIYGKIIDEAGDPMEGALVQLVRVSVIGGRKAAFNRGWAHTNDLGEYRFGRLGAGNYFLAVTGSPWYADRNQSVGLRNTETAQQSTSYAPVFFPNANDPAGAAPLVLKAGQELPANFKLNSAPGVDLTVYCENGKDQIPPFNLQLVAEGVQGTELFSRVAIAFGVTRLSSVPPGRYTIRVANKDGSGFLASKSVDATANADVHIDVKTPPTVSGIVDIQGGTSPAQFSGMMVLLHNESANTGFARPVEADGRFTFPGVLPGTYRVHVGPKKGAFVNGLAVGDTSLPDTAITVGPEGISQLRVTSVMNSGDVQGFVNSGGRPAAGVMVVLAPTDGTLDHIHYYGYMTDSDGSFDFEGVRPGSYRLFATRNLDIEYSGPLAVKPYLSTGKPVRVQAGVNAEESLELP